MDFKATVSAVFVSLVVLLTLFYVHCFTLYSVLLWTNKSISRHNDDDDVVDGMKLPLGKDPHTEGYTVHLCLSRSASGLHALS